MHIMMKSSLIALLLLSGQLWAQNTFTQRWELNNLNQPESVVADTQSNSLYISNVNGGPTELNGQGYISKVSPDGKQQEQFWIKGLDAPKGMAIVGRYLFVADMQTLHMIDIDQGQIVKQFKAPQAKMLNDVTAAPDGSVYISDFLGGMIYRYHNNQLTTWFSDKRIPFPNGLLWYKNKLLIGNWGQSMNADFTTQSAGSVYILDPKTQLLTTLATGVDLGNIDGIVSINDSLYVSDWISGDLFALNDKQRTHALTLPKGLADIWASDTTLYTPLMLDNKIIAWEINSQH